MKKLSWEYQSQELVKDVASLEKVFLANRGWKKIELEPKLEWEKITAKNLGIAARELNKAIKRLLVAKKNQEEILIFGDYDVDGNCAAAVMWLGLKAAGIKAMPFIPHRLKHGYGMSVRALKEIFAKKKPDLLITVDNGISAKKALEFCLKEGVEVIVTDHHLAPKEEVRARAKVHTTLLSGAGVGWFLILELLRQSGVVGWREKARSLLDLVCLATVVDQVPQVKMNRCLVRWGLECLRENKRVGMKALLAVTRIKPELVGGRDLGFAIGPRINAIGRLAHNLDALRLLCTESPKLAGKLAGVLTQINSKRQELTQEMFNHALSKIDEKKLPPILVIASEQFHEGIIGLLASKLADKYMRPAIVIAKSGEIVKASCRSVPKFNITNFLSKFRKDLLSFGGHAQAAGFSVAEKKLGGVKKKIESCQMKKLKEIVGKTGQTKVEARVSLEVIADRLLPRLLGKLEPFGAGNIEPVVQVAGKILRRNFLGGSKQHLKITLEQEGQRMDILFWNFKKQGLPKLSEGAEVAAVGELKVDRWRGRESVVMWGREMMETG